MAIPNEPITRKEKYLAKASGQNVETPDPLTREEMYLDTIAKGGGGGGGGVLIVHRDETNMVLDKTFSEIYTAMLAGTIPCVLKFRSEGQNRVHIFSYIFAAGILNGEYVLKAYAPAMVGEAEYEEYLAYAEDDYPEF